MRMIHTGIKTEYNGTVLENDEFNSTSWVWCMLENYGGNPSMDERPKRNY